ncbi:putative membrane protein [Desulfitobacterium dehalogenans ATCC 51507]|uniref:Putative membrane protein n=1 Tax=Desulfitobacterium dehalogenans (strain ATCC 51507 / DSM 9161 / JW/IU-DC1) TaxID=756499 RepID=I4ADW5_DESDJ|nr:DUF445 domain-containing protein [Desulfitobacterium dehalogenans]AFM02150.1 putative membrane protein [Desulfitobacterium dehalogenans ATCC 51507]
MNYRRKANSVLGSVFILFLITAGLKHAYPTVPGIHFFFFVTEAALVGGLADWFAVTALFRKPLGWPYHTALIPRNREKMVEAIVAMVQNELLSENLLRQRIQGFRLSSWLINTAEKSGGASFLAEKLSSVLIEGCKNLKIPESAAALESVIRNKLMESGLAKDLLAQLCILIEKDELDPLLNEGIEKGIDFATTPQAKELLIQVLGQIQEKKIGNGGKLQRTILGLFQVTDGINLDEAAEDLQIELILHLRELQAPYHPARGQLKELILEKLQAWERDPGALNTLESWKNTLFTEANLQPFLGSILLQAQESLKEGKLPSGQGLLNVLEPMLEAWWSEIKKDTHFHAIIDQFVQELLAQALQREHAVIGQTVRETLQSLSNEELSYFVEDKAGNDLQWIRINGSLVGGIVGGILFLILNYGYSPLLKLIQLY